MYCFHHYCGMLLLLFIFEHYITQLWCYMGNNFSVACQKYGYGMLLSSISFPLQKQKCTDTVVCGTSTDQFYEFHVCLSNMLAPLFFGVSVLLLQNCPSLLSSFFSWSPIEQILSDLHYMQLLTKSPKQFFILSICLTDEAHIAY